MKKFINEIGLGNIVAFVWLGVVPFCIYLYIGISNKYFSVWIPNQPGLYQFFSIFYLIVGIVLGVLLIMVIIALIAEGIEKLNNRKL